MLSRSALGEKPYVVSESIRAQRARLVRFGVNTNILRNPKQPYAVLAGASGRIGKYRRTRVAECKSCAFQAHFQTLNHDPLDSHRLRDWII